MPIQQTVLLVGGTGRTGQRVLQQLLSRGINVRVIVRSAQKLPAGVTENTSLTVMEANLLSLNNQDRRHSISGCDAVISCLGHILSFKGVFGPPLDLVTLGTTRLCRGIEALQPAKPVKFILMSSVSVNHPGGFDTCRRRFDNGMLLAWNPLFLLVISKVSDIDT
jgi:nucleoside-diphosphate-sugar epimerase